MNEVVNLSSINLSLLCGVLAGAYLTVFHPTLPIHGSVLRRALLQGWYFGFLGSILYVTRVVFAIAAEHEDVGRVIGGWILWLVFALGIIVGSFTWTRLRQWRLDRQTRRSGR